MRDSWIQRKFALAYLRAPKSHSIINLISIVSVIAVAIPTAAMVVLLSVYNGLDDLLKSMYQGFDPQIRITSAEGKYFDPQDVMTKLSTLEGVEAVSHYIEDNILASYRDRQYIATVRGVDTLYPAIVPIEDMVISGTYKTKIGTMEAAVVGAGVAYQLGVNAVLRNSIKLIAPSSESETFIPGSQFRSRNVMPESVFAIDAQTDGKYIITSIELARELFGKDGEVSATGLLLAQGTDESDFQEQLIATLGKEYIVKNRYEQKETLYTIMRYEKLAIYMIVMLVLLIASFSLVGSLIMLIEDKRGDIKMLYSVGANRSFVCGVFTLEGFYIVATGIVVGMVIGVSLVVAQNAFGIVGIGGETMVIDHYPVRLSLTDLVVTGLSVAGVGYLISLLTSRAMVKRV